MGTWPTDEAQRFAQRYTISGSPALLDAEMEVLGSNYEANGYTTRTQAELLGERLGLTAEDRLLDLGAGCGWPGLYLAKLHGCAVVSVDPVGEGLPVAVRRARLDGLAHRQASVRANGDSLPFKAGSFDAVVHTDVVC